LYEADLGSGNIYKFNSSGTTRSTIATGLTTPDGLAIDSLNNLYVGEGNGADMILKITPGEMQSTFVSGLNDPNDLAFNNAGDLFVADAGAGNSNGDILEFSSNGSIIGGYTAVSKPLALAFQPVPEPSMWGLVVAGAAGLLVYRRK
jgi:hypothetical protein